MGTICSGWHIIVLWRLKPANPSETVNYFCSWLAGYCQYQGYISVRFSRNSEAFASALLKHVEGMFLLKYYIIYMHGDLRGRLKYSVAQYCVSSHECVKYITLYVVQGIFLLDC